MSHKDKKDDDLDTETTIVDMNVEGFKWYDPTKRKKDKSMKTRQQKVTRKEYWRMVRAAFVAALPVIGIIVLIGLLLYGIAYLWLS